MRGVLSGILTAALLVFAGCDLFAPRAPELPVEESGTYVQPDDPEAVVANIQAALAELNTQNYRRAFTDDFTFTPTAAAAARYPSKWDGWDRTREEEYFRQLVEAARLTSGNELRLEEADRTATFVGDDRYELQAPYVLTVNHRQSGLPVTLQGRLIWVIRRSADGLWYLQEWTDREIGNEASWSDLKATFSR